MVKIQAFTAMDSSSVPGRGTKIPQALQFNQKTNKTKQNLTQEFELASLLTQSFCLMEERAEVSLGSD